MRKDGLYTVEEFGHVPSQDGACFFAAVVATVALPARGSAVEHYVMEVVDHSRMGSSCCPSLCS